MRVSVVIPARNAAGTLGRLLDALASQDPDEVIVCDNACTDETGAIAKRRGARVVHEDVPSTARARNRGWEEASGDVVAFLDADVLPHPEWLNALRTGFAPPICGGPVVGETATPFTIRYDRLFRAFMAPSHAHGSVHVPGANLAVSRDFPLRFDPSLPGALCEDVDFLHRARKAGYPIRFLPDMRVSHPHPDGWRQFLRQEWRRGEGRALLVSNHPELASDHGGPDSVAGYAKSYGPGFCYHMLAVAFKKPSYSLSEAASSGRDWSSKKGLVSMMGTV